MWAGRAWASGRLFGATAADDAIADANRLGLAAEDIEAVAATLDHLDGDDGGVWPENVAAVAAFVAVDTQWRTGLRLAADGSLRPWVVGLDYAGARAGLAAAGMETTPELWNGLRIIEAAAAAALNGD